MRDWRRIAFIIDAVIVSTSNITTNMGECFSAPKPDDQRQYAAHTRLFVVGCNDHGQLGLGHCIDAHKLTPSQNTSICYVYPGYGYMICSDKDHKNIWATGDNGEGQCCADKKKQVLLEWKAIRYFKKKGINVQRIFVNVSGKCTFFLSDNNQLFGAGSNEDGMLGLNQSTEENQYEPVLIDRHRSSIIQEQPIENVIEVQSGRNFCVALCASIDSTLMAITSNWCRKIRIDVPDVILELLVEFARWTKVYSTRIDEIVIAMQMLRERNGSENPVGTCWTEVEELKYKYGIKISVCLDHCLFLEKDGSVWWFGDELYSAPVQIPYFKRNKIKIRDIQCGHEHSLALDDGGNVYSFGRNRYGQCGDGTLDHLSQPKLIEALRENKVDLIRCGTYDSYCRTQCGKHYLFGYDGNGECLSGEDFECVLTPRCIDEVVHSQCRKKIDTILGVYPGDQNTFILGSTNNIDLESVIVRTFN